MAQYHKDVQSLIQAEHSFAQTAKEKGTKEAFLSVLADESVLFRPHPVNGKKWVAENPAAPGILSWEPVWVNVARSGDMGYTTGPFEYQIDKDSVPVNYGHNVSVWKKNPQQVWKLVMDVGIQHAKPIMPAALKLPKRKRVKQGNTLESVSLAETQAGLLQRDEQFSEQLAERGMVIYSLSITDNARLYRQGHYPFIGKEAIAKYINSYTGKLVSKPAQAYVASSGDFGYTYGSSTDKIQNVYFNYIRIWHLQKDDTWQLELDIHVPASVPKNE